MTYVIWQMDLYGSQLLPLYQHLRDSMAQIVELRSGKGKPKRKKMDNTTNKISIWDLNSLVRLVHILFDEKFTEAGLSNDDLQTIRQDDEFKKFALVELQPRILDLKSRTTYIQTKYSKNTLTNVSEVSRILFKEIRRLADSTEIDLLESDLVFVVLDAFKATLSSASSTFYRKYGEVVLKTLELSPQNMATLSSIVLQVIDVLIKLLNKYNVNTELYLESAHHTNIVCKTLEIIDKLLEEVDSTSPTMPVYSFIYEFTCHHDFDTKNYGIIFKILFDLKEKASASDIYTKFAMSFVELYGSINNNTYTNPLRMKALSLKTVDICLKYLLEQFFNRMDQMSYLIKKAGAYLTLKTSYPGKENLDLGVMENIEQIVIVQLLSTGKILGILCDAKLAVGAAMNTLLRLLIHYFKNLYQLNLYVINRYTNDHTIDLDEMNYLEILSLSKTLAKTIGSLIMYIENTSTSEIIRAGSKSSSDAKVKKVMRDSKYVPNLVFWMEKFTCNVITLAKKTKSDIDRLVHIGIVRDFRINTEALMQAINKRSNQAQTQPTQAEEDDLVSEPDDDECDNENE